MINSYFIKFIAAFTAIAANIETRVNGKKTELTYLFKDMLTKELSTDLNWKSLSVNTTIVAADVVALSSNLPLKKRGSFQTASGEIPKIGMKMSLTEKQMSDIMVLQARGVSEKELIKKIFDDQTKCTMGVYEKLEYMFQNALSSGVMLIDDDTNTGVGIRVDFGYLDSNKFGAVTKWSDSNAKPMDDLKRVIKAAKAKGDVMKVIMMSDETLDTFCNNTQVKEQFAFTLNYVGSNIPSLDNEQATALIKKRLSLDLIVVDRQVMIEINGKETAVTPWEKNMVVLLPSNKVGSLSYGTLVEDLNRNQKVMYAKVDDFILLKKWASEEPFEEFTSSQALVIPVINNVSSIYRIDSEEATASEDTQTEGNAAYAYKETDYTKTSVIDAINLATGKTTAKSNNTDATLAKFIDALSEEQVLVFEANITEVTP